jgi:hypothetical protein
MTALPDWMRPPRAEGWFAEDLDRLPEAPRHTELIDGALVFMTSLQPLSLTSISLATLRPLHMVPHTRHA